jgi:hypothetical protein
MSPAYRISRSRTSGGSIVKKPIDYMALDLKTFFQELKYKVQSKRGWREVDTNVYEDKTEGSSFEPVVISGINLNGKYTYDDFSIEMKDGKPVETEYYYAIESGYKGMNVWGPLSYECRVHMGGPCLSPSSVAVVENVDSQGKVWYEFLSPGRSGPGAWSSIQVKAVLPFIPKLIDYLSDFLDTLGGMAVNVTDSFSNFINGIKEKVDNYANLIGALVDIVTKIRGLKLDSSISYLYAPLKDGGVDGFMNRVRAARPPDNVEFSGPSGITAGIVFMFGSVIKSPFGDVDTTTIEVQSEAADKVFKMFLSLLGGK